MEKDRVFVRNHAIRVLTNKLFGSMYMLEALCKP